MSILLTGGAGYIGSHTCVTFLNAGYDVVVADNFCNSKPEAVKRVEEIAGKKVPLYAIDVADKRALDELFQKENIESVVHFAGLKAVGESCEVPLKYTLDRVFVTLTLMEVMEDHNVKKIVFSSSATVYGVPEKFPLTKRWPQAAPTPMVGPN